MPIKEKTMVDWYANYERIGKFNPTREEIEEAIQEYLERGGVITKVIPRENIPYDESIDWDAVNDFYIPAIDTSDLGL